MELLKVTRDIAIRCILFGACKIPKIGTPVSEFGQGDLIWAEKMFSRKELKVFKLPLWIFGNGYGSGSGDGSGDGDGYGRDIGAKILALNPATPCMSASSCAKTLDAKTYWLDE